MDLDIVLDRTGRALLSHQIGRSIVNLIAGGALRSGARLPATRDLAERLGVSRMTVVDAYGWLAEQGYVDSRHGSGTFVHEMRLSVRNQQRRTAARAEAPQSAPATPPVIDFRPGLPDLRSFPRQRWTGALARSARAVPDEALGYGEPLGHARLRSAIAAYMQRSRGFQVDARNIVITAGTAQAVDVLLRTLPAHREVVVETPGPAALERLPASHGVTLRRVRVDLDGLRSDLLPAKATRRRLAYIVPSHQFPLGCVMSIERRLALIEWAARTGAYIVEDDYDSEFAYNGRPAMPLAKLDPAGRVIYACTFSKTLIPALRIGFMIVPDPLLPRIADLKWWIDHGGWVLQQEALARWIEDGTFEQHVHRMRKIYRGRFELLTEALAKRLGERVRIVGQPVGMHVSAIVRTSAKARDIAAQARTLGVGIYPIDGSLQEVRRQEAAFVFGFGNVDTETIRQGVDVFADVLHERCDGRGRR